MKFELINNVMHRNGRALVCPYRTPVPITTPGRMAGQAVINFVPTNCATDCPLLELSDGKATLRCGCEPVSYPVEIKTSPPSKLSKVHA